MNGFSIVIPIYNEEENIDKLLNEIENKIDSKYIYEIICVNDASSEYSGEDYEKVAIHTLLVSSFLSEGKLNSAMVEELKFLSFRQVKGNEAIVDKFCNNDTCEIDFEKIKEKDLVGEV